MIVQAILDFFRDVVVNWIAGLNSLTTGVDTTAAGEGIGSAAAGAGHVLALFIDAGLWPYIVATWTVFLGLWLTTGLIAIIGRRMSGS